MRVWLGHVTCRYFPTGPYCVSVEPRVSPGASVTLSPHPSPILLPLRSSWPLRSLPQLREHVPVLCLRSLFMFAWRAILPRHGLSYLFVVGLLVNFREQTPTESTILC